MLVRNRASSGCDFCRIAAWALFLALPCQPAAWSQTQVSQSESLSAQLQTKLEQKGTLILRDATLIEALFAIKENWGVNIAVGNDVKGAINGAFTEAPLHRILDAILAPQGYGYRAIGDTLVIMKLDDVGAMKPLFVTRMLPLAHVPPDEVVKVIEFMLSPNGKAHAVPSSKSLVVMDYPDRIELIRQRIEELDAAAKAAADRLQESEATLTENPAARRGPTTAPPPATSPGNTTAPGPELAPGTADPASDLGGPSGPSQDNTLPPPGADPLNPADPLSANPGTTLDPSGLGPGSFGAGSLPATGTGVGRSAAGLSGSSSPAPLEVAFFAPQYVSVTSIAESLSTLVSEYGQVSVVAEENRIVAVDQPEYIQRIATAVDKLDVPRRQVRITAFIFDANMADIETFGINWNSAILGRNQTSQGGSQDLWRTAGVVAPAPTTALNGAMTFMSLSTNFDVTAVVNALRTSNTSRLLADPTVVVMDNESARIATVTEIPYQQLTESGQGGAIGTTAFREAGVTLAVTPRIARDGTVALVVTPTFSVLTGFTEGTNQPIIARREAQTIVRVANNQTLVIGGLRQRGKVRERNALPYLGDIKYIGGLFRYRKDEIRESELLVFLTPTIVPIDAFGTLREQRAFESTKCELEKVKQEECERCKDAEDTTIHTNSDFGGVPVTVPADDWQPAKPAESHPPAANTEAAHHSQGPPRLQAATGYQDAGHSSRRNISSAPRTATLRSAEPIRASTQPARSEQFVPPAAPARPAANSERLDPGPVTATAIPDPARAPNRVAAGGPPAHGDNPRWNAWPPVGEPRSPQPPPSSPPPRKPGALKSFFTF